MMNMKQNHIATALGAIDRGHVEETESGILIPAVGALAVGEYTHRKNNEPWAVDYNKVTVEFINYMLEAGLRDGTQEANWYMTLFGTGETPDTEWTASSFASLDVENTDDSNGYTSATRPEWLPGASASGQVSNTDAPVSFSFATSGGVTIGGIAILSSEVRGGSDGILASAANLSNSRLFEDGDTYDVTYRLRFVTA